MTVAETLTPQQKQAVEDRGGKLLVSAAAGSGKTKVLVDRLMRYLTDPVAPANIDEFLIITYTKAAASELRGKIAAKLSERISQDPANRHLRRQFQRLYLTQISTVHSFCSVILKEYAYKLDIPGDFRVADENECQELRQTVMEKVLEKAYDNSADDPDFRAFVDSQGLGRDDRQVPDIILKVYDSARCHLQPEHWLQQCICATETDALTDAAQTSYGSFLLERFHTWLDAEILAMEHCVVLAERSGQLPKQAALLHDIVQQLRDLRGCVSWDAIVEHGDLQFGTLRFPKNFEDADTVERIKAVREACKKNYAKQIKFFSAPSAGILTDLQGTNPAVRGMIRLVETFSKEYARYKRSRRVLDFSDLEHSTLDLLLGRSRSAATLAAREIGRRYREIMVDEYQDSNGVQDAIYNALTEEKQNLFLVGDVKQSIYQFRLADPGIFLEKYNSYVPAGEAPPMAGRKVMLSRNFRSGGAILSAANDVFGYCMCPEVGGLSYGADEALYVGIPHIPLEGPEVELCCIDVQEDTYREEAAYVAARIRKMLSEGFKVRNGDSLRPVKAEDIVILLRSPGSSGRYYQQALETLGIRCASGGGEDLLQTPEISALCALLQTIHNPLQDIPLITTLSSAVFGFQADDLARIRCRNKRGSFYEALCADPHAQSQTFLQTLSELRRVARMQTLTELLEQIFVVTHLDTIYGAMEQGDRKLENLRVFFQLAAGLESGSGASLGSFLEHLDRLKEKGLVSGGEQTASDCVTIMSIHKSKGLEFPVVFLCGLSRNFNMESQHASVLCHKDMGLGLSAVDHTRRIRYPTIAKRAIAAQIGDESLSEEMRVLYVAMTRPKDVLIMTYASNRLEQELKDMILRLAMGCKDLLIRQATCPGEWVLLTALNRTEAGALFNLAGSTLETKLGQPPWKIRVEQAAPAIGEKEAEAAPVGPELPDMEAVMERNLRFRYPHAAAIVAPSKQTATQRKGREKDQEAAENAPETEHHQRTWRSASFGTQRRSGKDYGIAVHNVMAYLRYENCTSLPEIHKELDRLVENKFITQIQRDMVDSEKIAAFFLTPIGKKLRSHPHVIREFKFSILEDGSRFEPALAGESVMLQGVVDCAMLDPDGIILMDFKTDAVTEETVQSVADRYRPQVKAYASALSRIYGCEVKQALLYFFRLNAFVEI